MWRVHIEHSVTSEESKSYLKIGMLFTGLGSALAGVLDLIWGEFEPAHQPIQAWGDHLAGIPALAYFAAALLIVGGIGLSVRRTSRVGAALLAIVYGVFTCFPLPRLLTAPHFLGYHLTVYIGLLVGVCQQLILFVPTVVVWDLLRNGGQLPALWARLARWAFGLCCIDFGLAHLTGVGLVARMIPGWLPFSGTFWTVITGLAFVAAGMSIMSGILEGIATRLLGLMLLIFSVTVLTPGIFAQPHSHVAWGGDAYNIAAMGSVWMFAGWLGNHTTGPSSHQTSERSSPHLRSL